MVVETAADLGNRIVKVKSSGTGTVEMHAAQSDANAAQNTRFAPWL